MIKRNLQGTKLVPIFRIYFFFSCGGGGGGGGGGGEGSNICLRMIVDYCIYHGTQIYTWPSTNPWTLLSHLN